MDHQDCFATAPYDWSPESYRIMVRALLRQTPWNRGSWQAMDVGASRAHDTYELEDVTIRIPEIPSATHVRDGIEDLQQMLHPDLPWAEDHFMERVSGTPYNPPPSAARWPYAVRSNADHTRCSTCGSNDPAVSGGGEVTSMCPDSFHSGTGGQFDHTYPERFWPKFANVGQTRPNGRQVFVPHNGIRYEYGDLSDVVGLLARDPYTRQAFLPVWFPEDTGAVDGQRVPCTIGYHFMRSEYGALNCRYYIRSCDIRRHLTNDVYLACRLVQWVAREVTRVWDDQTDHIRRSADKVVPGRLMMHIGSLHAFRADEKWLEERV